jgi:hypothetical protein
MQKFLYIHIFWEPNLDKSSYMDDCHFNYLDVVVKHAHYQSNMQMGHSTKFVIGSSQWVDKICLVQHQFVQWVLNMHY